MLRKIFFLLLIVLVHFMLLQLIGETHLRPADSAQIIPLALYDKATTPSKVAAAPPPKTPFKKNVSSQPGVADKAAFESSAPSSESTASADFAKPASVKPAETTPALSTLPPPSASYLLDVVRTEPQLTNPYYGSGEIHWVHDGSHYTMSIEINVNILFAAVRLYRMQSAGTIDQTGIQPYSATETRRGKATTHTYFNYDNHTVHFSANSQLIALSEGAQDKATVLMQLAGIGNAGSSQFQPGKSITIQVAEEQEANLHQFVVLDQETIDTRMGQLSTWHIVRPPRLGSYSSRIDIWFAPELHWLPVQIRNTESNGAITTQTIRKIIQDQP